jgi:hypothetical protein
MLLPLADRKLGFIITPAVINPACAKNVLLVVMCLFG